MPEPLNAPLLPAVTAMSPVAKKKTSSSKVKVKVTSPVVVCPSRSLVIETVGRIVSTNCTNSVATTLPFPARSSAASAATFTLMEVSVLVSGVTSKVYTRALVSLTVPAAVPPVITTSPASKPVTSSSKVKVKVTSPLVAPERSLVIESVGSMFVSTNCTYSVAATLPFPARSSATLAPTFTLMEVSVSAPGVTTRV